MPFQKKDGSRKSVFLDEEKPELQQLPTTQFEISHRIYQAVVGFNFHVAFDNNFYSVPYTFVRKKVDIKYTSSLVEIYDKSTRIASHPRFSIKEKYKYSTFKEHMPLDFVESKWDEEKLLAWALSIGEYTHKAIKNVFNNVKIKEQAYKPALAILSLSKAYTKDRLENACEYCFKYIENVRYKNIKSILENNQDINEKSLPKEIKPKGYIRNSNNGGNK
jgi:hypothetical protein